MSNSDFVAMNMNVLSSKSEANAAIFYLSSQSFVSITTSTFIKNQAKSFGLILMTGDSFFTCNQCLFDSNQVSYDTSIIYADNNPNGKIYFNNSLFTNNTSMSNIMSMITTRTVIENSIFIDNFSQLTNNGITSTHSEIQLNNVTVNYTNESFILNNTFQVDSCFFVINVQSVLRISSSRIQNCRGGQAGVLFATGQSSVYIGNNSIFEDNLSAEDGSGSALMFFTTKNVEVSNSTFKNNGIIDIYLQRSQAVIDSCSFQQGDQQFIYGYAASLTINNSYFINGENKYANGKAIYCYCTEFNLENSVFQNLSAVKGGAVYLSSKNSQSQFKITNSMFIENNAQAGGALFIQDTAFLTLHNNQFVNNKAQVILPQNEETIQLLEKGQGGSIYLSCQNQGSSLSNNCYFNSSKNLFLLNQAEDDGGAIFSIANPFIDSQNIYIGNQALYGSNLGTYPKYIQIQYISNGDYYDPNIIYNKSEQYMQSQNYVFDKIVSGTPFSFQVKILDQSNELYVTDSQSVAQLRNLDNNQFVLLSGNEVPATRGVFNFTSVTAISYPGKEVTLSLLITGINTYGNQIDFVDNPINITLKFRYCVAGEKMESYACIYCTEGYYSYEAPQTNNVCETCNKKEAQCDGGTNVFPLDGYWRESNISEEFIHCPRPKSCLKGDESHKTGICSSGYYGIVCGNCQNGYSRKGDFECVLCPNKIGNILKITFIFLGVVLIVVLLVYSSLNNSTKSKFSYSIYVKIMTSHFQIISSLANVNFSWPKYILQLYNAMVAVSSISQQFFSVDCFLSDTYSSLLLDVGIYFSKLFLYGILPIILAIVVFVFFTIFCTIKGNFKTQFKKYFISTYVVLLFLVHPTITQEMLQAFNCVKIGEVYYLRKDISYVCYKETHLKFLLFIVIPSTIVWCLGIPLAALVILLKNKQLIQKEQSGAELTEKEIQEINQFKVKFGFIYNGYKIKSFYYEIIIQYRKVALILSTVILSIVSPEVQALVCFLILSLGLAYLNIVAPYLTQNLNRMESLSLIVSITTLYSGMYFITAEHYDYGDNVSLEVVFLILMILPNFAFFVYWLYYMAIEILKLVHKKNRKLFKFITCCLVNYHNFGQKYLEFVPISDQTSENSPSKFMEDKSKPKEIKEIFVKYKQNSKKNLLKMQMVAKKQKDNQQALSERIHLYEEEKELKEIIIELKDTDKKKDLLIPTLNLQSYLGKRKMKKGRRYSSETIEKDIFEEQKS